MDARGAGRSHPWVRPSPSLHPASPESTGSLHLGLLYPCVVQSLPPVSCGDTEGHSLRSHTLSPPAAALASCTVISPFASQFPLVLEVGAWVSSILCPALSDHGHGPCWTVAPAWAGSLLVLEKHKNEDALGVGVLPLEARCWPSDPVRLPTSLGLGGAFRVPLCHPRRFRLRAGDRPREQSLMRLCAHVCV